MVVAFVVVVLLLLLESTIIIGMRAKINRTTDAKASHDKNTQRAVGVVESFPHEVVHETKATKLEGINSSVAAPSSSAVAAATMTMKMMTGPPVSMVHDTGGPVIVSGHSCRWQ